MAGLVPRLGPWPAVLEAEARWILSQAWSGPLLVLVLGGGWVQNRILELALPQVAGINSTQLDWSWLCLVALQALCVLRLAGRRSLTQELAAPGELIAHCAVLVTAGGFALLPSLWGGAMFHVEHGSMRPSLLWVAVPQVGLGLFCLRAVRRPLPASLVFLALSWWLPAALRIPGVAVWPTAVDSRSLLHLWANSGSTWNLLPGVLLTTSGWTALALTLPRRSGPRSDTD